MCVHISHCKLLWIRTSANCACVVVTGVALTGPICHPQDLWWIDNEQKHKHKRLKMNTRRLEATFSAQRNVEQQHDVTSFGISGQSQGWQCESQFLQ